MRTAIDLINLSSSVPLNGDVPERVWRGKDVSYDHLRVFGCRAYLFIFLKTRGPSLMIRQNHVLSWGMVMKSLGKDCGIH